MTTHISHLNACRRETKRTSKMGHTQLCMINETKNFLQKITFLSACSWVVIFLTHASRVTQISRFFLALKMPNSADCQHQAWREMTTTIMTTLSEQCPFQLVKCLRSRKNCHKFLSIMNLIVGILFIHKFVSFLCYQRATNENIHFWKSRVSRSFCYQISIYNCKSKCFRKIEWKKKCRQ